MKHAEPADEGQATHAPLDPWLLERLVCPATRAALRYDSASGELVSEAAGLAYPVRDGVPVLIVEAARRLDLGGDDS